MIEQERQAAEAATGKPVTAHVYDETRDPRKATADIRDSWLSVSAIVAFEVEDGGYWEVPSDQRILTRIEHGWNSGELDQ